MKKKKWILLVSGLLAALGLVLIPFFGTVWNAQTDFEMSKLHGVSDIKQCARLVKWHFFCNFYGSELLSLSYDAQFNEKFAPYEAESGDGTEAIILHSDWVNGRRYGAEPAGHVYRNWKWIFEKTPLGLWELTGNGYG